MTSPCSPDGRMMTASQQGSPATAYFHPENSSGGGTSVAPAFAQKTTVHRKHRPPNLEIPPPTDRPPLKAFRMPSSASIPSSIPLLALPEKRLTSHGPSSATVSGHCRYRSPSLPINVLHPTTPVELPSSLHVITGDELAPLIGDSQVFLVDIRPFKHFCNSRIKSATNICIPSTLLKRPNYSLSRFAECMASEQRHKIDNLSQYSHVVVYDESSMTVNATHPGPLAYTLAKFAKAPELDGKLYYLQGGIHSMEKRHSDLMIKSADAQEQASSTSAIPEKGMLVSPISIQGGPNVSAGNEAKHRQTLSVDNMPRRHQHRVSTSSTSSSNTDGTSTASMGSTASSVSPVLCGFSLPALSIGDVPPSIAAKTISNVNYDYDYETAPLSMPDVNDTNRDKFPKWLMPILGPDGPKIVAAKFKEIQQAEKNRLESLFMTKCVVSGPGDSVDDSDDPKYSISKAVEFGHKNRYNNIWPFDHSRVVLNRPIHNVQDETPQSPMSPACDYINASYVSTTLSHKRYIATQAPLPETFADFWKVVWDESCPVILMLTAEAEGGFLKSHTYWTPGQYGKFKLTREKIDEEIVLCPQTGSKVTIRRFLLSHKMYKQTHRVSQIHYTSWPDLGTPVSAFDLLALCKLKDDFTKEWKRARNMNLECGKDKEPVGIIHCSAGCGRTGTFCTIDSVIDILSCKSVDQPVDENEDVIFHMVNEFRRQRLSMVQTMRQYAMCYEAAALWCAVNR